MNEQRVFEDTVSFDGVHRVEALDSTGKLRIKVEVSDDWWDEEALFSFLWGQIDDKDTSAERMQVKRYIRLMPAAAPVEIRDAG